MSTLFPRVKERLARRAGTVFGGGQQTLTMARALMSRPSLACMDEPTMGLSPLYVDKVLELIRTVNQQGVSFFTVEQNASLALQIAHRGYVCRRDVSCTRARRTRCWRPAHPRRLSRRRPGCRNGVLKSTPGMPALLSEARNRSLSAAVRHPRRAELPRGTGSVSWRPRFPADSSLQVPSPRTPEHPLR